MNGKKLAFPIATILLIALGLGGCGGGSDSSGISSGTPGMLSGTAVKGPVNGGTVRAYAIQNGSMAESLGSATTDSQGHFSMSFGDYSGPVLLQMQGGTYTDEATGNVMAMATGDVMTAVIPSVSPTETISDIQITPLTSMAQSVANNMAGGMTEANVTAANEGVSNVYGVGDILTTQPMNPLVSDSGAGASEYSRNYGMVLAAMSQYAYQMRLSFSSAVVAAMMNDAADGTMDGMMDGNGIVMGGMNNGMTPGNDSTLPSIAGTSGLADAMNTFLTTSTMNRSGLRTTDMQRLMDQLRTSDGLLLTNGGAMDRNGKVSGTAFNGTVRGATVAAYAITNGTMGGQIASTATDAHGNYSLPLGAYDGPFMLRMSGGTYTDLATDTTTTMPADITMTAVVPGTAEGNANGIEITPLTSMAQVRARYMNGGMTAANITAANRQIGAYFMVDDILTTPPMDPLTQGSGTNVTQDSLNYGMTIAAMSQYAQNLGMADPAAIITAMMNDASDGVMNGMMGASDINVGGMEGGMMNGSSGSGMQATAGTSGLAQAMQDFMRSASNMSGLALTDIQPLIDQLNASNGAIQ